MSQINQVNNHPNFGNLNIESQDKENINEIKNSFGNTMSNFLDAVNNDQIDAKEAVADILTGKSENLHEAMAKVEESKLSFELMIEIRNKLLEGFKEIERMPV